MCVCGVFTLSRHRWIQSFIAKTQQVKNIGYVNRNSMFNALNKGCKLKADLNR